MAKIEFIEATGLRWAVRRKRYDDSLSRPSQAICSCFTATAFSTHATGTANLWPEQVEAIVANCVTKSADCVVKEIFKAVTEHAAVWIRSTIKRWSRSKSRPVRANASEANARIAKVRAAGF